MFVVTGGTGFIGSAVVRELIRRGAKVCVVGRDARKAAALFGPAVEARVADVRDASQLSEALSGAEVVIDAVQFPNSPIEDKRKGWTFEEFDLKGTRNQVDAAKATGGRRFVYLSGVGAAPDAEKHWFRFKWEAETYLQKSGLEWVVVRPTWVYGPDDNSLNRLLGFAKFLPFVPMFGGGGQPMQPVFIDDVARVVTDCAEKAEAANNLFELGGPEVMTMNEVLKAGLEALGKSRAILHQPVAIGKLLGTFAAALPSPRLSPGAVDFITAPAVADNRLLEEVLRPKLTPLREGLRTYLGNAADKREVNGR